MLSNTFLPTSASQLDLKNIDLDSIKITFSFHSPQSLKQASQRARGTPRHVHWTFLGTLNAGTFYKQKSSLTGTVSACLVFERGNRKQKLCHFTTKLVTLRLWSIFSFDNILKVRFLLFNMKKTIYQKLKRCTSYSLTIQVTPKGVILRKTT